jgi:hypothetical protein
MNMNPDITNPDDLTFAAFDNLLSRAAFTLLPENARNAYAGASMRCLYAIVDGLEILCEDGVFNVYGMRDEANDFAPWCVSFAPALGKRPGCREQIL